MLFHGVVSVESERVVQFFLEHEQAEAFIADVEQDEPETATQLRIERVRLSDDSPN
jgi:hypothetical protein